MSDVCIRVENVSKKYVLGQAKGGSSGDGLRHALQDTFTAPFRKWASRKAVSHGVGIKPARSTVGEEFHALRNVSFEVKRGDVLGIIGRNGAGKSTLLKILSRITEPTEGRIGLKGRVASLLEVGTGFHPELTGRENIFLNGAILGMTRAEVRRKMDQIIDFAEVSKFLDTPVKRYSSGMYVRLAFAVAAHLEPDVLVVDEVLAVGDAEFQKKCLGKMNEVAHGGRTVLFVSHQMTAIKQLCRTCLYLDRGSVKQYATPDECIASYMAVSSESGGRIIDHLKNAQPDVELSSVTANGRSDDFLMLNSDQTDVELVFKGRVTKTLRLDLEAKLTDSFGNQLAFFSPGHETGESMQMKEGEFALQRTIRLPKRMNKGEYTFNFSLTHHNVIGWVDLPTCLTISTPGTNTKSGRSLNASEVGWLYLEGASSASNDRRF
jgi:lipopolysaccharide transport system ATP-binding protein